MSFILEQMKAVAVLDTPEVQGIVLFFQEGPDVRVEISIKRCPFGNHGLHIHKAGDLRQGCKSLCDHWTLVPSQHGGPPQNWNEVLSEKPQPRHTGDLGNVNATSRKRQSYRLTGVSVRDLQGRSIVLHKDADDLGLGPFEDSLTTGHSGERLACAIIGRASCTE